MRQDTKEALLTELAERAPNYVPEWRLNLSRPDVGAALALLWTDMFLGSLERFSRLTDNYRRSLLDVVGSDSKPAIRARGYLAFEPRPDAEEPIHIPAGTGVACPQFPAAVLETDRSLTFSPALFEAMYYVSPARDTVRLYDGLENQTLFQAGPSKPHIWTLFHPYAFDVSPDALLSIRFTGTDASWLCEKASWEFEDGSAWKPLAVRPDEDTLLLLFPPEREELCRRIRFTLRGGGASEAVLESVIAFPVGNALFPDAVYSGETQQTDSRFYPFDRRFLPGYCLYIACNDAFSKPGAAVELSFQLSFEDFPIEGYSTPPIRMKKLMRAEEFAPPEEYEIIAAEVVWEYYNGIGWASLPGCDPGLFADCRERRCVLRFICPGDIRPALCGAHDALFIRARIVKADNLFRMHGNYKTPVISEPRFRYGYERGVPVVEAEVREHLEIRPVTLDKPVALYGALPSPGAMYFAFDRPFTQGTFLLVVLLNKPFPLRWEYASTDGWNSLDIRDGTSGLSKMGLITWQTAAPCKKLCLFGREAYWMRLCDTENRYESASCNGPRLIKFYQNAVMATAREAGASSNLPAGAFCSLLSPVSGIAGAMNPMPVFGGSEEETEDEILQRLTDSFHHGGRAVSPGDYEKLTLAAFLQVCRVRCYPNTDENGCFLRGCSCLVLLCIDTGSYDLLGSEVLAYLETLRPVGSGKLCVSKPRFIAVNVTINAVISEPDAALLVKTRIAEQLARYLEPVSGGTDGKGWAIGTLPEPDELTMLLRSVPGVLWITRMETSYLRDSLPLDYRRAVAEPFVLPLNGTHEISLIS